MKKVFALALIAASLAACNGGGKTEEAPAADTTATMTEAPAAAPAADTTAAAPAADTTAAVAAPTK